MPELDTGELELHRRRRIRRRAFWFLIVATVGMVVSFFSAERWTKGAPDWVMVSAFLCHIGWLFFVIFPAIILAVHGPPPMLQSARNRKIGWRLIRFGLIVLVPAALVSAGLLTLSTIVKSATGISLPFVGAIAIAIGFIYVGLLMRITGFNVIDELRKSQQMRSYMPDEKTMERITKTDQGP